MKRSILALALGAMFFCSCKIENGTTSKHTAAAMEAYTKTMFRQNIIRPTILIKNLIELDRYIYGESNQLSDEFAWHRKNIYHLDDITFQVTDVGNVYTYGKSLFDSDSAWEINDKYERLDEKTWKIYNNAYYDNSEAYTIITYEGRDEQGNNILKVEAYDRDECRTFYPAGDYVTAVITLPEGPMTLHMATDYRNKYAYDISEVPEGSGVLRIETQRNNKPLDWMELRYSQSGKELVFKCNL